MMVCLPVLDAVELPFQFGGMQFGGMPGPILAPGHPAALVANLLLNKILEASYKFLSPSWVVIKVT